MSCLSGVFHSILGKFWENDEDNVSLLDMPDEVLETIFSFLTLPDRKNVRLVCHRCCNISYSAGLVKRDVLNIQDVKDLTACTNYTRATNVTVSGDILYDLELTTEYWSRTGCSVTNLEIMNFPFYESRFQEVFQYLPNLTSISVHRFNVKETEAPCEISLPSLQRFEIFGFYQVTEKTLSDLLNILESAPKLQELYIAFFSFCNGCFNLISEFVKRKKTLTRFELFNVDKSWALIDIIEALPPKLEYLGLTHCTVFNANTADFVADHFQYLNQLNVTSMQCSDEILSKLLHSFQFQLTRLNLSKTLIEPSTLILVAWMPKLKALDISFCEAITPDTLHLTFGANPLKNLIDLRLGLNTLFHGESLNGVFKNVPNLEYLSVHYREISNEALLAIAQCAKLRYLSIVGLSEKNSGFILNDLLNLKQLNLSGRTLETAFSFMSLSIPKLESLFIFRTKVPTTFLENFATRCPSLKNIFLESHHLDKKAEKFWKKTNCKLNVGKSELVERSIFDCDQGNMFYLEH